MKKYDELTDAEKKRLSDFYDALVSWVGVMPWHYRLRFAWHYLKMVFYKPFQRGSEGIRWLEEVWMALRGYHPAWDDWSPV